MVTRVRFYVNRMTGADPGQMVTGQDHTVVWA